MNSEIRNELLIIMNYVKHEGDNGFSKESNLSYLLERFECDLKRKEEDLNYELGRVRKDMETLYYVKNELGVK